MKRFRLFLLIAAALWTLSRRVPSLRDWSDSLSLRALVLLQVLRASGLYFLLSDDAAALPRGFALLAVPLFIFAGELMNRAGVTQRLISRYTGATRKSMTPSGQLRARERTGSAIKALLNLAPAQTRRHRAAADARRPPRNMA